MPVALIASGSKNPTALGARDLLAEDSIQAAVVSHAVLGSVRCARRKISQARSLGRHHSGSFAASSSLARGAESSVRTPRMNPFGASENAPDLYKHFRHHAEGDRGSGAASLRK